MCDIGNQQMGLEMHCKYYIGNSTDKVIVIISEKATEFMTSLSVKLMNMMSLKKRKICLYRL